MSSIPNRQQVRRAIVAVEREVKTSIRKLNQDAGSMLAKGRYDKAEDLVATAKSLQEFQAKAKALRTEWRALRRAARPVQPAKDKVTPLWEYYKLVLQCLQRLGGEAKRSQLERDFEAHCLGLLKPDDSSPTARGVPRWKKMIQRARQPMIQEGLLEKASGGVWCISAGGKKAATPDAQAKA